MTHPAEHGADLHWYVVQTHANAELKTTQHLARQGFGFYLPRYLKQRRHARRIETVPAPLFPRYVFVAVDMAAQRWRAIRSTIGVSDLVCAGDAPAPVAPAIIDGLRQREDGRGFVRLEPRPPFLRGERIRVVDGVFSTCLGLFEGVADRERVAILLDLLGRKVRVTLDLRAVAAA
jgi:transcriptional antiterminator RfaH